MRERQERLLREAEASKYGEVVPVPPAPEIADPLVAAGFLERIPGPGWPCYSITPEGRALLSTLDA